MVRVVDHDVKPGVEVDMGPGDAWPAIRQQVLAADILVLATPIWMGQPSSVTKRVLERLDAELSEKDDEGRLLTYGKVAVVAVVGNEDGAHHTSAELFQALNDVGFTDPGRGRHVLGRPGDGGHATTRTSTRPRRRRRAPPRRSRAHAAHLARLLRGAPYPPS